MQTETINPTFNSSLIVFAEKTRQMLQAKRNYLRVYKTAPEPVKKKALQELKQTEDEVETLIYAVLDKPDPKRLIVNGGGISLS
jgi:hypothetical protein